MFKSMSLTKIQGAFILSELFFDIFSGLEITLVFVLLEKEKILNMHVTQKKTCLFSAISKR